MGTAVRENNLVVGKVSVSRTEKQWRSIYIFIGRPFEFTSTDHWTARRINFGHEWIILIFFSVTKKDENYWYEIYINRADVLPYFYAIDLKETRWPRSCFSRSRGNFIFFDFCCLKLPQVQNNHQSRSSREGENYEQMHNGILNRDEIVGKLCGG